MLKVVESERKRGKDLTPINLEPILAAVRKAPEGEGFLQELEEEIQQIQTKVEELSKVAGAMVGLFAHADGLKDQPSLRDVKISIGGDGVKKFVESVDNEVFCIGQAARNMRNGYPWDAEW